MLLKYLYFEENNLYLFDLNWILSSVHMLEFEFMCVT